MTDYDSQKEYHLKRYNIYEKTGFIQNFLLWGREDKTNKLLGKLDDIDILIEEVFDE